MPRLMSVSFTEQAVRDRRKTVTRRAGWSMLRTGDRITLCRKVMGRKKGEPIERITDVEIVSVRREPLSDLIPHTGKQGGREYAAAEMEREGFPGMDPAEFVRRYFTEAQRIGPDAMVTRVEWRYLDGEAAS